MQKAKHLPLLIHYPYNTLHPLTISLEMLKYHLGTQVLVMDRILWRDLACFNDLPTEPLNLLGLTHDLAESRQSHHPKKICQHPLDTLCLSMWFFCLFYYLWGQDTLAKAKEEQREGYEIKREP